MGKYCKPMHKIHQTHVDCYTSLVRNKTEKIIITKECHPYLRFLPTYFDEKKTQCANFGCCIKAHKSTSTPEMLKQIVHTDLIVMVKNSISFPIHRSSTSSHHYNDIILIISIK